MSDNALEVVKRKKKKGGGRRRRRKKEKMTLLGLFVHLTKFVIT